MSLGKEGESPCQLAKAFISLTVLWLSLKFCDGKLSKKKLHDHFYSGGESYDIVHVVSSGGLVIFVHETLHMLYFM